MLVASCGGSAALLAGVPAGFSAPVVAARWNGDVGYLDSLTDEGAQREEPLVAQKLRVFEIETAQSSCGGTIDLLLWGCDGYAPAQRCVAQFAVFVPRASEPVPGMAHGAQLRCGRGPHPAGAATLGEVAGCTIQGGSSSARQRRAGWSSGAHCSGRRRPPSRRPTRCTHDDPGVAAAGVAVAGLAAAGARATVHHMDEAWRTARERWERERLDPTLRRTPERRLRFRTLGDIDVRRLYTPLDLEGRDLLATVGFPGQPPFTRGIHASGYRGRLWTMRMFAGFGSAEDTNARFHQLLDAGQTGLSIAYDMPTLYGYDTDDPHAEGEFGTCGVAVSSLADMEILLAGIPLDRISTSMTINSPAAPIWAIYIAAAEKRGYPRAILEGTTQNDILKEYIAQKEFLFPVEPSLRLVTDTIEFGTRELPKWNTISISGYHIREAGATAVQELAFTIADGITYVEEALRRGLQIDEFAPRLSFFFNAHSDFFEEIAKYRAARRIWYRLMTERWHAKHERSTWLRFHAQTAGVSLTAQQPLNNLTRVAIQALAAVLGGAQSLHTDAYDEAWAVPSAEAALLALRQQQVIAAETGVASTVDPLGGAWYVEWLTDEVERQVWRYIAEIDALGGMPAAIAAGFPQREIADAAYRYQQEFDSGERQVIGVNAYADPNEELTIPLLEVSEESRQRHLARLARVRRERDPQAVEAALARLRDVAARPGSSTTNVMPALIECAAAYVTLGEMCGVFRAQFGEYREPVAV
jgi:methylmalonyl-CoA mutase N-terminal domain/subunit